MAIDAPISTAASTKTIPLPARILIGALGGAAAVASKLLGFDAQVVSAFLDNGFPGAAADLKVLLILHTPLLILLGAIVTACVDETVKLKLFAIGVSAPAILTPWLAQAPVADLTNRLNQNSASLLFTPAYAQSAEPSSGGVSSGLGYILGTASEPRYRVVVGSYTTPDAAIEAAKRMKAAAPGFELYVGEKRPNNQHYPVIVGSPNAFLPYPDARNLKAKVDAAKNVFVNGSYYSGYDYPVRKEIK